MRKMIFDNPQLSILEIEQTISRNPLGRFNHRLHVVILLLKGYSTIQAAKFYKDNPRTVKHWGQQYKKYGVAGLMEGKRPGRPRKITLEELEKVRSDLKRPTADFGYKQGMWDGPLLRHHLEKQYHIELTVRHCQRIFHYLKMSLKRPRPKMAGASTEAQETFKKKLKN